MSDRELFDAVFKRLVSQYNLKVERPYGSDYVVLKDKDGGLIGDFNPSGYNLLAQLTMLCDILHFELI